MQYILRSNIKLGDNIARLCWNSRWWSEFFFSSFLRLFKKNTVFRSSRIFWEPSCFQFALCANPRGVNQSMLISSKVELLIYIKLFALNRRTYHEESSQGGKVQKKWTFSPGSGLAAVSYFLRLCTTRCGWCKIENAKGKNRTAGQVWSV